jgi:hypothetical protein
VTEQGWQDIASAPKGETVLLGGEHPNHGWVVKVGRFFAGEWWSNGSPLRNPVTHWLSLDVLPAPPEPGK